MKTLEEAYDAVLSYGLVKESEGEPVVGPSSSATPEGTFKDKLPDHQAGQSLFDCYTKLTEVLEVFKSLDPMDVEALTKKELSDVYAAASDVYQTVEELFHNSQDGDDEDEA